MRDRGVRRYSGASFGGLVDLPRLKRPDERRLVWRQVLVALARSANRDGPGPLEAIHPDTLVGAVKVALADGLLDDTEWLSEAAAGAALYELASAVPVGNEQREVGRRVLGRLLQGNAETFTAIATRMAFGTGKGLSGAGVRARIALVIELPLSVGIADGPMCLAFVARRQL
ncbi:MAG TPA: serine/threonine protein kinase, partial [Polyangiaceae bacterium]|nr:serine/threonine protein kinase [Polyangiaceae bacterium]